MDSYVLEQGTKNIYVNTDIIAIFMCFPLLAEILDCFFALAKILVLQYKYPLLKP